MFEGVTSCPACGALFRVTEKHLLLAEGSVRCGVCRNFFQAEDHFVSPMLDATELIAIKQEYWSDFDSYASHLLLEGDRFVDQSLVIETIISEDSRSFQGPVGIAQISESDPNALMISLPDYRAPAPNNNESNSAAVMIWEPNERFTYDQSQSMVEIAEESIFSDAIGPEGHRFRPSKLIGFDGDEEPILVSGEVRNPVNLKFFSWLSGILVLATLLVLQYSYLRMDQLVHESHYRPYYKVICRYLGCSLPEFQDLSRLQARELVVRSHPSEKGALVIDALLRNSGQYRQLFPNLRLRFFDIDGDIVAGRVFKVSEYLAGEMRGLRFIPSNTEVRISLEIVDPGKQALGYQMDVIPYQEPN